jgi:hypothetical protein
MAKRSYAMQEVQQKLEVAVPAMFQKDDVSNLGFLFGVITLEPIEGNSPAIHALHAVMHVAQIWCCSYPFYALTTAAFEFQLSVLRVAFGSVTCLCVTCPCTQLKRAQHILLPHNLSNLKATCEPY